MSTHIILPSLGNVGLISANSLSENMFSVQIHASRACSNLSPLETKKKAPLVLSGEAFVKAGSIYLPGSVPVTA